ncbi:MAG: formamidopyrimidine-DNA glycosylase [Actinomycetia bacterium]|nr:formamidopyrimidine-DNA glycosylase [Actinomycetes bacterium]
MPELPEVETVRVGLERHVVGRVISEARVLHPRAVRRDPAGSAGFEAAITGRQLDRAERRGKYLWLAVGDGMALLAHLGMSGQMLVGEPGRPVSPHVRAWFTFTDGGPDLRFTDQRTFGHLMLVELCFPGGLSAPGGTTPLSTPRLRGDAPLTPPRPGEPAQTAGRSIPRTFPGATPPSALQAAGLGATPGDIPAPGLGEPRLVPVPIAHIAPDPLEAAFSPQEFAMRLRRRRTGIKRALLDQSLISGIGNIYADEALWRAKLHWARPTETMRPSEVARLLTAVNEVLTEALKAGGTSFDSLYVNVNGQSGYFDRSLEAYGRAGQPCSRCATLIRRDSFMNRSSFSCPRCQPRPRSAHW